MRARTRSRGRTSETSVSLAGRTSTTSAGRGRASVRRSFATGSPQCQHRGTPGLPESFLASTRATNSSSTLAGASQRRQFHRRCRPQSVGFIDGPSTTTRCQVATSRLQPAIGPATEPARAAPAHIFLIAQSRRLIDAGCSLISPNCPCGTSGKNGNSDSSSRGTERVASQWVNLACHIQRSVSPTIIL